jgi:hypothetical protein
MASIEFALVDELITARRTLHGGVQGAPRKLTDRDRTGAALNRSIILMLSALFQGYVEDVFFIRAKRKLRLKGADVDEFRKLHRRWGNPSMTNITEQFGRIGIIHPLANLSWQGCRNASVRRKIDLLNTLRNQIAHGAKRLKDGKEDYNLTLAKAENLRRFVEAFSTRFQAHIRAR